MSQWAHLAFGSFTLDLVNARLRRDDREVPLRPRSFSVLRHFVERAGQIVTKDDLRTTVWGGTHVSDTVFRVCVQEIREALGDTAATSQFLQTLPRRGYRFVARVTAEGATHVVSGREAALARVVGRDTEVAELNALLARAEAGDRRIVFVTGSAGVGKTTVVELFLHRAAAHQRMRVARGQCLERHGEGEAYLPIREALGRLCREPGGDRVVEILSRCAPTWLVQMPALVSDAEFEVLSRKVRGTTQARMLREITEAIEVFASDEPLVIVIEDLQWSDDSTLEAISYLARRRERARLLLVGTYRPAEVALRRHAMSGFKDELLARGQCHEVRLDPLSEAEVTEYTRRRLPPESSLSPELIQAIHRRTEGNPLFVTHLLNFAAAEGLVTADPASSRHVSVATLEHSVPETVGQLINKQIDTLEQTARATLEVASVVGPEFGAAAVAAGTQSSAEEVEQCCDRLVGSEHFLHRAGIEQWPDGTLTGRYRFTHAMYVDVLYERIGAASRVRLHQRIGTRKEKGYGAQVGEIAGELALHFERGHDFHRAALYCQLAGENSLRLHAVEPATRHLRRGLALLGKIPDAAARTAAELALQATLGHALLRSHGGSAANVGHAYDRALELCAEVEQSPHLVPVLLGLQNYHLALANLDSCRNLGERLSDLAQRTHDPAAADAARYALAMTRALAGDLRGAREQLRDITLDASAPHPSPVLPFAFDVNVRALSLLAFVQCLQGFPTRAVTSADAAIAAAVSLASPFDITSSRIFAACVHQLRRDAAAAHGEAAAALHLAEKEGFPLVAQATILQAWAQAGRDGTNVNPDALRAAVDAWHQVKERSLSVYLCTVVAETCIEAGEPDMARALFTEGMAQARQEHSRVADGELHRIDGELILRGPPHAGDRPSREPQRPGPTDASITQAEACFTRALDIARRQDARWYELRAAISLGRLWTTRGEQQRAAELVGGVYDTLEEGRDTQDAVTASELIAACR
jgi:DNA-binding winged helix-turn-helix (wHTH) protein/ActR/RegA family two-component response regulator